VPLSFSQYQSSGSGSTTNWKRCDPGESAVVHCSPELEVMVRWPPPTEVAWR
jgi:hypothetical protein